MTNDLRNARPRGGRVQQKLKTRRRLLQGARALMGRGEPVTVVAAAREAGISTATAYRYFSDPESLKLETVVELDLGRSGDFLGELEELYRTMEDIGDRVVAAHRLMVDFVRRNEPAYRLFLAKGHELVAADRSENRVQPRGGRRIPMFELALAPARRRLGEGFGEAVLALAAAAGPEPYFVLKDVCRLPDAEIDRIAERNLRILIAHFLPAEAAADQSSST